MHNGRVDQEGPGGRQKAVPFGALRHRDFRLFWTGSVISQIGAWMRQVAQAWLVYELTGSALLVGLNGLFHGLPFIVTSLYAGTVVDRVDRRRLIIWLEACNALNVLILGTLVATGHIQIWHIYASAVAHSVVGGFESPSRQALLPHLVPRADLMTAVSLNSIVRKGAQIIGPALGGVFVAVAGVAGAYYVQMAAGFVLMWCVTAMRTTNPPATGQAPSPLRSIVEGLNYTRGQPIILSMLLMEATLSLFSSYQSMMVIFAKDVFGMGAEGLGILQSAAGAGSVVGSFALAGAGDVHHKGRLLIGAGLIYAAAVVCFAYSPWFALALPLLMVAGASDVWFSATRITIMQLTTPSHMLGRVMSLSSISMRGIGNLGTFQLGTMSMFMGVQSAVAIGAVLVAIVTLGFAAKVPTVRNFIGSGEAESAGEGRRTRVGAHHGD